MPLIIPQASSCADATSARGGVFAPYIQAQIRSDADLAWLRDVGAAIAKFDELKSKDIEDNLHVIRGNRELLQKFERGVGQASIVLIEAQQVADEIVDAVRREGHEDSAEEALIRSCATAIIGQTPIAYLPLELARVVPVSSVSSDSLADFSPEALSAKLPGLRQAKILAARSHAKFDVPSLSDQASTRDSFTSPLSRVLLSEYLPRIASSMWKASHPWMFSTKPSTLSAKR